VSLVTEPIAGGGSEHVGSQIRPGRRADRHRNRDRGAAIGMIGPNLVLFTIFVGVPILGGLALSFTNWNLVGFPHFTGLANYRELLNDPMVSQAIETTVIFVALGVVPTVLIGLVLAMLVNVRMRFISAVRTLYFVPAVVSFAASAVLWNWIYRPGQGLLDYLLYKIGIIGPAWLASTTWALPALDIVTIWISLPTAILLYMAALQRIPDSVIEAATIDGAGPLRRLRYVIWPGVRNMTALVAVVSLLTFTSGSFDLVNILTQGGPISATTTLIYYTYYVAFQNLQLGYGAALSVLQLFLIVGIIVALRLVGKLLNR
jgi:ABC-type sugar transport system permease subunit